MGVYGGGGGGNIGGEGGLVKGGFIEKKPIAASIQATSITSRPMNIMVKMAPISSSNPAVLNIFSLDFCRNDIKGPLKV